MWALTEFLRVACYPINFTLLQEEKRKIFRHFLSREKKVKVFTRVLFSTTYYTCKFTIELKSIFFPPPSPGEIFFPSFAFLSLPPPSHILFYFLKSLFLSSFLVFLSPFTFTFFFFSFHISPKSATADTSPMCTARFSPHLCIIEMKKY